MEIPAHSFYHEEALASPEARLAFCKLSLLANSNDRVALRYWLGAESDSWLAGTYKKLRDYCEANGVSPWDALERLQAGQIDRPRVQPLVDRFSLLKDELLSLQGLPISEVASALFPAGQEWATLLSEAALRVIDGESTPASLLSDLRDLITQPELPEDVEYVQIMSLHKSKGLTRQAVIVCGCIEGFIPTIDETEPPAEQARLRAEQRRLFYVSITRTRNVLLLSSARDLPSAFQYQGAKFNRYGDAMVSSFLRELGPTAPRPVSGEGWVQRGFV